MYYKLLTARKHLHIVATNVDVIWMFTAAKLHHKGHVEWGSPLKIKYGGGGVGMSQFMIIYLQWWYISSVKPCKKFLSQFPINDGQQVVQQLGKSHAQLFIHQMRLSSITAGILNLSFFFWEF